jgi:AcrR family transcriptional regulator
MDQTRRVYRRESEESRRSALITATQELVAEGGPQAATVRAIAARAGVTAGLIRHYFHSKEELTRAAYVALMDGMISTGADALESVGVLPQERLAAFVAASMRPPVMDSAAVGLWAGFIHNVRNDAGLLAMHEAGYLRFRDILQALIATLPREATAAQLRADAIACNGVIDGLWLEGSLLPHAFAPGEILTIALRSVGAILGTDLLAHSALVSQNGKTLE